jgi:hemolysin activation/secretion protein
VLRGETAVIAGLPIDGVTRSGDRLASRRDGDARFVAGTLFLEWNRSLQDRLNLVLATSGQLASRPLLATAELAVGGPSFGRAFDYGDRTGDQGLLGSAELRLNLGALGGILDRVEAYAFGDGGHVDNLRDGRGGGTLVSTGAGFRVGRGPIGGMVELAVPVSGESDEGTRVFGRLSARF